jgi:hypothetical protein
LNPPITPLVQASLRDAANWNAWNGMNPTASIATSLRDERWLRTRMFSMPLCRSIKEWPAR